MIDDPCTRRAPKILLLAVTTECNAKCRMCSIWNGTGREMDAGVVRSALEDDLLVSELELLGVTGGEPSLCTDIEALIAPFVSACRQLRQISFTTNGLCPDRIAAAVSTLLRLTARAQTELAINISLDGCGDVHDTIRNSTGAFDLTCRSIDWLLEARKNENRLSLQLNTVISSLNADHLRPLLAYASERSLPVSLSMVMETDTHTKSAEMIPDLVLCPDQRSRLLTVLSRLYLTRNLQKDAGFAADYANHLQRMLRGLSRELPCPFRNCSGCLLFPNGELYICGVSQLGFCGNVTHEGFSPVWARAAQQISCMHGVCSKCSSNCYVDACYE